MVVRTSAARTTAVRPKRKQVPSFLFAPFLGCSSCFIVVSAAKYFAARGFVVFSIEYRIVSDGAHFKEMAFDVRAAISQITNSTFAQSYGIDLSRVFIIGRSRGGHLATVAAYSLATPLTAYTSFPIAGWYRNNCGIFPPFLFRGVINLYGAVNPYGERSGGNNMMYDLDASVFGVSVDADPELWRNGTSLFIVNQYSPSTLILQVHIRLSLSFFSFLRVLLLYS